jgi:hypothetical protein
MNLLRTLRNWLGLNAIEYNLARNSVEIANLRDTIQIHNAALGRVIAKLDPMYAQDEINNPQRRAESDRLGEAAIARIRADFLATKGY